MSAFNLVLALATGDWQLVLQLKVNTPPQILIRIKAKRHISLSFARSQSPAAGSFIFYCLESKIGSVCF